MTKPLVEFAKEQAKVELSDDEVVKLAQERGYITHRPEPPAPVATADVRRLKGDRFKVAIASDLHFGSKFTQHTYLQEHYQYFKKQKVSAILVPGDITDGAEKMHIGFVYELWAHGFDAQRDVALEHLPDVGIPQYLIAGNHDASHWKDAGADIVDAICRERDDLNYLSPGMDPRNHRGSIGYVKFGNVLIQLAHPHMGSTRTRSYRMERWIEELSPETKGNVIAMGNFHKALFLDYRNVAGLMVPSYQAQSSWMASKGISSYIGGCILEFGTDQRGIAPSINIEWIIERVPISNDWPKGA